MTLDQLTAALKADTYTPRTDEELRSAAEQKYASIYDRMRLTAQQNYDANDLAYQQQLANLQNVLSQNQNALTKNVMDSLASADRYTVTRGMQRSSYGAANRANIQNKGAQGLAQLMNQYAIDAGGIENNRTLAAQQLADVLAQYDIDYLNDVNAYMEEQRQLDYDRKVAADAAYNDIQMALYEYGLAAGGGGGGGGRGGYGGGGSASNSSAPIGSGNSSLFDQLNSYSGNSGNSGFLNKTQNAAQKKATSASSKVTASLNSLKKASSKQN